MANRNFRSENTVESEESGLTADDRPAPKRRWYHCCGGVFTTLQMAGEADKEAEVKITLRELIIYSFFLTTLLIVSLGMTSTTMYYYTKVLSQLFLDTEFEVGNSTRVVTFRESTNMADFWAFAETAMIDGFFWDFWYHSDTDEMAPTDDEDRKILYENKLLGLPRLRQVKVRDQSCAVHDDFRRMFSTCYDFYSESAEFKGKFGPGVGTPWVYSSESSLGTTSHWGKLATYEGGGFYQDLTLEREAMQEQVADLKRNLWLDRGTRAIFLEFTVYNANVNLFCIIKLVLELPPTGGAIPSWSLRTVKLLRYVELWDFFVLSCEFFFVCFLLYYTAEEVHEIVHFKRKYLRSYWNLLDLVILILSYACVTFSIYRYVAVSATLGGLLKSQSVYVDFTWLGFYQMQYNNAVAVLVFLGWVKVFKYISFNKTMSQLSNTLSRCAKDVGGFAVMFFVVFCAFAQLGYLLFGTQVGVFSSFIDSVFTLLRTILGDFDYEEIEDANRILGPIFFLSYIFFVFFVLLNMFLAIISDTYSEVKAEIATSREGEKDVAGSLSRGWRNMLETVGIRSKPRRSAAALSEDQIRALLRKCNFTELEIEMFFAKYDIDKSKMVSPEETRKMLRDLEAHRGDGGAGTQPAGNGQLSGGITQEEFYDLEGRVLELEGSIGTIVDKVDIIISKLENRTGPPRR